MAKKVQQTMEFYEILKHSLEATFEKEKKKALEFYELPVEYSQAELEDLK
jgi:hypothetical protein